VLGLINKVDIMLNFLSKFIFTISKTNSGKNRFVEILFFSLQFDEFSQTHLNENSQHDIIQQFCMDVMYNVFSLFSSVGVFQ
jgi:hypothetical protein